MATSNTIAAFREIVGRKILGLYRDGSSVCLVFDDGTGFAFNTEHGSYWNIGRYEVAAKARDRREELERLQADLRDVVAAEGLAAITEPQS